MRFEIRVIFEDLELVVVDKPCGIVVNNSNTIKEETVQSWFENNYLKTKLDDASGQNSEFLSRGGLVHRLDRDTSGVMVLALNEKSYLNLKDQFLNRKTAKTYLTLVHGSLNEDFGIVSTPIERHPVDSKKFWVGRDPLKTAITEWKVIKRFRDYSYLEVKPLTGRTHQIRVHMRHLGHPVVSDPIYGNKKTRGEDVAPRLFLHATKLCFDHPTSGQRVEFESVLPKELEQVISKLVD